MSQAEGHVSAPPGRAMPPASAPAEPHQYLTFLLGGETFAFSIQSVMEILQYTDPTSVPMMPDCVRGVINLRGSVVPVMDLAIRFNRQPSPVGRRTCIVILEIAVEGTMHRFGVLADAASEVLEIGADAIEPVPEFGVKIDSRFVRGLGKVAGRFVVILDPQPLFGAGEISALPGLEAEADR
jgi:purine-binding chemotaxis protein CheW